MDSILELLDPQVLTASYQQRKTTRPTLLSDTFYTNPEQINGDSFELFVDPFESEPAPFNTPGSEARVIQASGADSKIMTLFASFNKLPIKDENVFHALREPDSPALQNMAKTEIKRQLDHFHTRQMLSREVALAKILTKGVVYLNAAGQVLESSSGATVTADFNVPADHKDQCGGLIAATWATAGTDIQDQFDNIDIQCEKDGVPKPRHVWANSTVKDYLRANTDFRAWASASASISENVAGGSILEGLFGKTWHFYDGTYKNAAGTETMLIPDDQVIMTPDPTESVFKATAGSSLYPTSTGVGATLEDRIASLNKVYGPYSYSKLEDDPIQLFLYMGDKWGFHMADTNAVYMPTIAGF